MAFKTTLKWITILLFPFMLGFGTIRAVINWDYPGFEYPRLPSDFYGWSDDARLELGRATLDYLQRWPPADEVIYLLEDLRLPEDPSQPLYNDREIKHMVDVKNVADILRNIFWVSLVICAGVLIYFFATDFQLGAQTLYQSGWSTIIILAGIAVFILVGWSLFFVWFHQLLFPPGTWTFFYTDSLIRLFPEQFWFDVGVIISVATLLEGVLFAVIGYFLKQA